MSLALIEYHRRKKLPASALGTAAVAAKMNDMFDLMNSISIGDGGVKKAIHAAHLEDSIKVNAHFYFCLHFTFFMTFYSFYVAV